MYLRTAESVSMAWRRINFVCPHGTCYKKIALPIYICPTCSAEHKRLLPGSYGILRRRCQCTTQFLPTLGLFGRAAIPAKCPQCSGNLAREIGASTDVHVPLIGGPASGKTSYLIAATLELERE